MSHDDSFITMNTTASCGTAVARSALMQAIRDHAKNKAEETTTVTDVMKDEPLAKKPKLDHHIMVLQEALCNAEKKYEMSQKTVACSMSAYAKLHREHSELQAKFRALKNQEQERPIAPIPSLDEVDKFLGKQEIEHADKTVAIGHYEAGMALYEDLPMKPLPCKIFMQKYFETATISVNARAHGLSILQSSRSLEDIKKEHQDTELAFKHIAAGMKFYIKFMPHPVPALSLEAFLLAYMGTNLDGPNISFEMVYRMLGKHFAKYMD